MERSGVVPPHCLFVLLKLKLGLLSLGQVGERDHVLRVLEYHVELDLSCIVGSVIYDFVLADLDEPLHGGKFLGIDALLLQDQVVGLQVEPDAEVLLVVRLHVLERLLGKARLRHAVDAPYFVPLICIVQLLLAIDDDIDACSIFEY